MAEPRKLADFFPIRPDSQLSICCQRYVASWARLDPVPTLRWRVHQFAYELTNSLGLTYPLVFADAADICHDAGIHLVGREWRGSPAGINGQLGSSSMIQYRATDTPADRTDTVLHEMFEIVREPILELFPTVRRSPQVMERESWDFAAQVHMPIVEVVKWLRDYGFDLVNLNNAFLTPHRTAARNTTATLNMLRRAGIPTPPHAAISYECTLDWDRDHWSIDSDCSARYVTATRDFSVAPNIEWWTSARVSYAGRSKDLASLAMEAEHRIIEGALVEVAGRVFNANIRVDSEFIDTDRGPKPLNTFVQIVPATCGVFHGAPVFA